MATVALLALALLAQTSYSLSQAPGSVKDDPHFVGKYGVQFDFHGELDKTFCLVTDTRLQINAFFRGYKVATTSGVDKAGLPAPVQAPSRIRSWIHQVGILWKDDAGVKHVFELFAREGGQAERGRGYLARVVLDGEIQALPYNGGVLEKAGMSFFFTGANPTDAGVLEHFQLYISKLLDCAILMRPAQAAFRKRDDAEVHFNFDFKFFQSSDKVHGVLGQTYRRTDAQKALAVKYSLMNQWGGKPVEADDDSGEGGGFLDGHVQDYVTSGLNKTDCRYSRF